MPPQVIVRAADAKPYELQDLLPSDTRFKVLVFTGDMNAESQRGRVNKFTEESTNDHGFLTRYGQRSGTGRGWAEVFEVITILIGTKETVEYTCVPPALRPHWSK